MTASATTDAPAPDLAAIKQRQQATWSSGDYQRIATQIQLVAEVLIESLDVRSTELILDVATGSGNAALAAARRGCTTIGVDYVPALLERARLRAAAEGLDIEFVEGDAEALPFADGGFDVVTSVYGSMFTPDQVKTAGELARVCRPGGRIGVVAHAPGGFIGQVFKTVGAHVPPPAGLASPLLWGTEARIRELFADAIADISFTTREHVFRERSPEAFVDYWRQHYGPTLKAFEAVGPAGRDALEADLVALIGRFNRATDGTMVVPNEYLETVITRR